MFIAATQQQMAKERLDYLDGWRGLAISLVLIGHFFPVPGFDIGRLGVDVFFVLSGLLMARILFERKTPIGEFYRRRISRIIPAYFLFLAVILMIEAFAGQQVTLKEVLALGTFTRTYIGDFILRDALPIHHIWSLNVEEHCYLILGGVASIAFLSRRAVPTLVTLGLSSFVAIGAYKHFSHDLYAPYLLNTECAASYLVLSAGYRLIPKRRVSSWMPVAALALTLACYAVSFPKGIALPCFLLVFTVNHLEDTPRWFLWMLRTAGLRWLGVVSYSVYLWQQPFYTAHVPFGFAKVRIVGLLLSLLAGCASFYMFENPIRRWLNANWDQPLKATGVSSKPKRSPSALWGGRGGSLSASVGTRTASRLPE